MAGEMELGPLDEKAATLVDTGFPTSVIEGLSFTTGELSTTEYVSSSSFIFQQGIT